LWGDGTWEALDFANDHRVPALSCPKVSAMQTAFWRLIWSEWQLIDARS
jgi:hypothetical protein